MIFGTYDFDDSINGENVRNCGSISPKTFLIFHMNVLDFKLHTIEKKGIINPTSYGIKNYSSVVLSNSEGIFLQEWEETVLLLVAASHQIRLDTRSKARKTIKVGIKGRGGRERAETRTLLV